MKIKRLPLIMKNLIRYKAAVKFNQWDKSFDILRGVVFETVLVSEEH